MSPLDDATCQSCGYALKGLTENRCPECSRPFNPKNESTFDTPRSRSRCFNKRAATAVAITIAAIVVLGILLPPFKSRTPFQRPRFIIEKLQNPATIQSWTPKGLRLEDGRTIPLPDLARQPLPCEIPSQLKIVEVEIKDDRVYANVRVHHWCGNDPVRRHIARVDLALFLIAGSYATPSNDGRNWWLPLNPYSEFTISKFGLRVGDYYSFRSWCQLVAAEPMINSDPES
jgi:hypothetical protein